MYACAQCTKYACSAQDGKNPSRHCPMNSETTMKEALDAYNLPENRAFYIHSSEIEALGYGQWPRIKETIVLCKKMGYRRIGLAFCRGLRREAKIVDDIFRRNGFEVISVICKAGGVEKESMGVDPQRKLHPGEFEPMCNPIAQAMLLNEQETEFNVVVGLCVGHDSMFFKYAKALSTTLIAKDRALAHNPAGALYCSEGYYKNRIDG